MGEPVLALSTKELGLVKGAAATRVLDLLLLFLTVKIYIEAPQIQFKTPRPLKVNSRSNNVSFQHDKYKHAILSHTY